MPTLHHLVQHLKIYGSQHKGLYLFSTCVFFLILFDGIVAYVLPVIITERGFSTTTMGLIISASSIVGALFDFVLSRVIHNSDFRRLFFVLFTIVAFYLFFILNAYTIGAFLLAMAFWGIYFDLYVFSTFDYVSRYTKKEEHASSFAVVQGFASLGGLVAPTFLALAWPSISDAYADYISETSAHEEEIEGVQDFFGNGGYVIGPIASGLLADRFGIPLTFTIVGILCAGISLFYSLALGVIFIFVYSERELLNLRTI